MSFKDRSDSEPPAVHSECVFRSVDIFHSAIQLLSPSAFDFESGREMSLNRLLSWSETDAQIVKVE